MVASGAMATTAGAAFHDIRVSEVHNGVGATDDFFELQMFSNGQNQVATHHLRIFDAIGGVLGDYAVPTNLPNGETQRTFTIGNTATQDYNYGGATVGNLGGAVCWNEKGIPPPLGGVDCVSWGTFTPGVELLSSPAGANAAAIPPGQSLNRKITPGCATLFEAADDTNNSATDFVLGAATPRNNTAAPTEKPCTPAKKKCKKKKKKKGKVKAGSSAKKKKKSCKKKKKK
jgi:hypothetical protein